MSTKNSPIILASTSPRRQEILKSLGVNFEIISPNYEEIINESLPANIIVADLAFNKGRSVLEQILNSQNSNFQNPVSDFNNQTLHQPILSADTVVAFKNKKLGKPSSAQQLEDLLKLFSGNTCEVFTGHALFKKDRWLVEVCKATVHFDNLSEEQIQSYIYHPQADWHDKAGGFAVQGLASKFTKVEGEISTVIGLSEDFVKKEVIEE